MSNPVSAVVSRQVSAAVISAFTRDPAFTRLEPQSVSGDPTPGLEARVHDALWMILRQWQLGEFEGEDNGSPLLVEVKSETSRVTAWQPGDPVSARPVQPLPSGVPLDPFVEREATTVDARGLRQRAEAGAYLVELLEDAGFDARQALIVACPLPVDPPAADPNVPPEQNVLAAAVALMASGAPDSDAAAAQIEAGAPPWLAGAPAAATDASVAWLGWYRANVAPVIDPEDDSWIPERLEYRFSLRVGAGDGQMVLRAPAFEGGFIDWHAFDAEPGASLALNDEPEAPAPDLRDMTVFASPLRFSGMPSDRYWQLEDGQVNLGSLEAQPYDLGRLCLAEFALVYGNDWLVVPMDVGAGTFTRISEVAYTNTFGERFTVPLADDSNRSGRFRMYALSVRGKDTDVPGLFIPPTALGSLEGQPVEDVMFLRDEMANMAWAIERFVQGRSGDPRNRGDEERPVNRVEGLEPQAEFQYLLETAVPRNWIPFVPIATGIGTFNLRKGTMHDTDSSLGVLLRKTPYDIHDEEIPRAGIRVRRLAALARAEDGRYMRWITRRASVGRGEGSSGLAFDSALKP
jgi:hypothetical protein